MSNYVSSIDKLISFIDGYDCDTKHESKDDIKHDIKDEIKDEMKDNGNILLNIRINIQITKNKEDQYNTYMHGNLDKFDKNDLLNNIKRLYNITSYINKKSIKFNGNVGNILKEYLINGYNLNGKLIKIHNIDNTKNSKNGKNNKKNRSNKEIYLVCPHCNGLFIVKEYQIACGIFRHAVYKDTMKPINPHAKQEYCEMLIKQNKIFGCGKPFKTERNINNENGYNVYKCDYQFRRKRNRNKNNDNSDEIKHTKVN